MEEHRVAIGARIREARHEKGWKQKELASAVSVEPVTVSRWERGQHAPDLDMLALIADKLGKPRSFFIQEPATASSDDAPQTPAQLRQMVREEVEAALGPVELLLQRLLDQEPPESTEAESGGRSAGL